MSLEQQRYDIVDSAWEKIKLHTIGEKGTHGGNAKDTRRGILDFAHRSSMERYGHWENVHRRFCRWRDKGGHISAALIDDADFEWMGLSPFKILCKEATLLS